MKNEVLQRNFSFLLFSLLYSFIYLCTYVDFQGVLKKPEPPLTFTECILRNSWKSVGSCVLIFRADLQFEWVQYYIDKDYLKSRNLVAAPLFFLKAITQHVCNSYFITEWKGNFEHIMTVEALSVWWWC